jgi:hypothetical protein
VVSRRSRGKHLRRRNEAPPTQKTFPDPKRSKFKLSRVRGEDGPTLGEKDDGAGLVDSGAGGRKPLLHPTQPSIPRLLGARSWRLRSVASPAGLGFELIKLFEFVEEALDAQALACGPSSDVQRELRTLLDCRLIKAQQGQKSSWRGAVRLRIVYSSKDKHSTEPWKEKLARAAGKALRILNGRPPQRCGFGFERRFLH